MSRTSLAQQKHALVCARSSLVLWIAVCAVSTLRAGELVLLGSHTWDEYAPRGKEADCIYGDYSLGNDKLVAVVARPISGRNANMTIRNVGGAIIDLTRVNRQND